MGAGEEVSEIMTAKLYITKLGETLLTYNEEAFPCFCPSDLSRCFATFFIVINFGGLLVMSRNLEDFNKKIIRYSKDPIPASSLESDFATYIRSLSKDERNQVLDKTMERLSEEREKLFKITETEINYLQEKINQHKREIELSLINLDKTNSIFESIKIE